MTSGYHTIVADPPWEIAKRIGRGGRRRTSTAVPYSFMSIDEIKALPVADLAADTAHLYLWATRRLFREGTAAAVARAWGFEPCAEVIWGLRNPGMGSAPWMNDHEPVLVASRGSLPFHGDQPGGVQFWRQRYASHNGGKVHSAKPEAFLDHVEAWSPAPYLELFARRQRLGWDTWGDEAFNSIAR
jgi:N6-adenosine-specific RNA methylase IME4